MKICILGSKSFPPISGGIETHISEIAPRIQKNGLLVSIIVGENKNRKKKENIPHFNVINVPVIRNRFLYKISMIIPTLSFFKKNKFDIIHAHDVVFGYISNIFLNTPIIYTFHAKGYHSGEWPLLINIILKKMQSYIIKKSNHIITVNREDNKWIKKLNSKCVYIPNGINVVRKSFSKPFCIKLKIPIIFIGRLIPVKGVDLLIKAYSMLDERYKQITELIIIGDGPEKERLVKLSESQRGIHILGELEHKYIFRYLYHSKIFVLPSYKEGFPIALLEAMSFRNACICSDLNNLLKVFSDKKHILYFKRGNINSLNKKLILLIENPNLREQISINSEKFVNKKYNWEKLIKKIILIYKENYRNGI